MTYPMEISRTWKFPWVEHATPHGIFQDLEISRAWKIEIINKDMKLIIYSPDNWDHIHEGRYMQYIRMQNKQMIICENISGSAGDPH